MEMEEEEVVFESKVEVKKEAEEELKETVEVFQMEMEEEEVSFDIPLVETKKEEPKPEEAAPELK